MCKRLFNERKEFILVLRKTVLLMPSGQLFLIIIILKVLLYYLSTKQVNGCKGDGFSSVGA